MENKLLPINTKNAYQWDQEQEWTKNKHKEDKIHTHIKSKFTWFGTKPTSTGRTRFDAFYLINNGGFPGLRVIGYIHSFI